MGNLVYLRKEVNVRLLGMELGGAFRALGLLGACDWWGDSFKKVGALGVSGFVGGGCENLLNEVSGQARPLLSLLHRFLNAVEPGTVVEIHRRVAKDECFVVLRGKVRVTTHDDDGAVIGDVVLS